MTSKHIVGALPVIGWAIAVTAQAAPAGGKFDLECQGPNASGKIAHLRWSIDLDNGVYCDTKECELNKIVAVDAGQIVLERKDYGSFAVEIVVNRLNGTFRYMSSAGGVEGTCSKEPFTPMPAAKF